MFNSIQLDHNTSMKNVTYTENRRVTNAPVNLDIGKPTAREAWSVASSGVGFIALGLLCLALGLFALPEDAFIRGIPFNGWRGFRHVIAFSSIPGALICFAFSRKLFIFTLELWGDYRERLLAWDRLVREAYLANNGVEITRSASITELDPSVARDLFMAGLIIMQRVSRGEVNPFSVRSLEKPLKLSDSREFNLVNMGVLSGTRPEKLRKAFEEMGIITGTAERITGVWVPESLDQYLDLFVRNYHKIDRLGAY